jgi:hypothetical protein
MPTYSRTLLIADVTALASGDIVAADLNIAANIAAKSVFSLDLKSAKRKSALSPNLFDDIYAYSAPSDLKGMGIIDVRPQIDRNSFDNWTITTPEEFDRKKSDNKSDRFGDPIRINRDYWSGDNLVAIDRYDGVAKVLLSRPVDDDETSIDPLDSVGSWVGFGDGTNLTADADDYVKGSGSINWDINADGGTTAGIVNSSITAFDVSAYKTTGSVFVWAYVASRTNLTNFIIRIGSSASAYYYITVTTNNEGNAFENGWNLLRFDFANKATTGTPTDTACSYVAIYMTKAAGKVSETDYRFDQILMKQGEHYNLHYYSKYPWQTNAGVYIENATADTDLLNADIEEYELILTKTLEKVEQNLKNYNRAGELAKEYVNKMAEYIFENPSEALVLTQTYHEI